MPTRFGAVASKIGINKRSVILNSLVTEKVDLWTPEVTKEMVLWIGQEKALGVYQQSPNVTELSQQTPPHGDCGLTQASARLQPTVSQSRSGAQI